MALKVAPVTNIPSQHPSIAALPPAVVACAIDCTETPLPALAQELASITSVPGDFPALSEELKDTGKSIGGIVPNIRPLSSVKAGKVDWLWEPYLPLGMLAMLSGDPGVGKTWTALALAASLTVGRTPYTNAPRPPGSVLYFTVENTEQELQRRFSLLGGNPDLLHITEDAVRISDISYLNHALEKTKAHLMIFDPIQSFLGASVDTYRANKIRPVMDDLSRLAKKHGCCILLLRHLTKGATRRGIHRGSGGIDLSAAVRSELLAGHAANDPKQFALVHTKSNLGQKGVSLGYAIGPDGFGWTGESNLTDQDLLAPESHRAQGEAMTEAKDFLLSTLSHGPCMANQVFAEAKELYIKEITLKRAKKKLNIQAKKDGQSGPWLWSLPEGVQTPHTQKP
jgi:hypothetical protein